MKTAQVDR